MDNIKFSSLLRKDEIKAFLTKRAGFNKCELGMNTVFYSRELAQFFSSENKVYVLAYTDFSMSIKEVKAHSEPTEAYAAPVSLDDWLCFLKDKFGESFVKHYAEVFDAEKVIFEKHKFLSEVSKEDIFQIIRNTLEARPMQAFPSSDEIIEVESFYSSERRFLVKSSSDNSWAFVRLCDFGFVEPRISCNIFWRFMTNKFGKEYIDAYEKDLYSNLEHEGIPKFIAKCHEKIDKRISELLEYLKQISE